MQYPLTDTRRAVVLDLLAELAGRRPAVVAEEQVGHEWAPVTRLGLDIDVFDGASSVVVKTRRVEREGYGGPAHLRREQAGLKVAEASGVAPRLIAADDAAGVVIESDLGRWPTLESVLLGDDTVAAERAVVAFGTAMGRLHASTSRLRETHAGILESLGAPELGRDRFGQWPGVDRWDAVEAGAKALGFPDATTARDDVDFVRERLLAPSLAALVHTDLNPTNALITVDGVRLVDFEGAIFGHPGMDASFLHYPFPNYSANWSTLPPEVAHAADVAYREELQPLLGSAPDGYDTMLAVGAAAALAIRVQRLPRLAEVTGSSRNQWRRRAQLVQQIGVFTGLAARAQCLEALSRWFSGVADAIESRWPDTTTPRPPIFPAFATGA